jgi:type IV secretory pathway TrbL component
MNPLYQQMNNQPNNFFNAFNQFRQNFKGDAKEQVQNLLNSGKVSQSQYDNAVKMANQIKNMFGI